MILIIIRSLGRASESNPHLKGRQNPRKGPLNDQLVAPNIRWKINYSKFYFSNEIPFFYSNHGVPKRTTEHSNKPLL